MQDGRAAIPGVVVDGLGFPDPEGRRRSGRLHAGHVARMWTGQRWRPALMSKVTSSSTSNNQEAKSTGNLTVLWIWIGFAVALVAVKVILRHYGM
jgi:hypothetical protein